MKFTLFSLLFSLLFSACANAPGQVALPSSAKAPSNLPSYLEEFVKEYTHYFEDEMLATNTPGAAIVIVKDSQIIFIHGYGPRIAGLPDSIDKNTVFRIGSLSKGFAGVLTGMLVQDSLLCWDDCVQKYYPDFTLRDRKQAARIRLWHLLSHTSGLPYHAFTNLIEKDFSIPRIVIDYFPQAPMSGKEGEFYAYQNAALCVIEEVMLHKTGKTYPQILAEKIFIPAGMRHASCDFEGIHKASNKTLPHFAAGWGGWRADSISALYYNAAAAGGVNASISDMGEWLKLLLGNRPDLVADTTLDRVFHPVVKTDKERRIFPHWLPRDAASYAMGWRVLNHEGDTILYHGGYVNGYKSEIALNRRDGIGICVLFNANTALSSACIPAFFEKWEVAKKK
ncbi:MAG: serine hydrolase domain-containing protein [Saprospiraceae bacterium]|nr:serine hydrolase domain-containing protein [Saprospiraceae bacterium]